MAPLSRKIVQVVARRLLHSVKHGISMPSSDVLSTYSNVMFQCGLFIVEACASFQVQGAPPSQRTHPSMMMKIIL